MTVREAFLWGREHLAAAGSREAAVEAELLLRHAAGWDRAGLYARWESALPDASWAGYRALLDERAAGRPVHYILGVREFMGLSFLVDERVLIPRPETELLVDVVIRFLEHPGTRERGNADSRTDGARARSRVPALPRSRIVVDVGTGSGCIAVAVARAVPQVSVIATDISAGALELAGKNARRHELADRVRFLHGDLLEPLPAELAGRVDVIVSNPPYVAQELAAALPREIREFEPAAAVVAPGDGLGLHRSLAAAAPRWLRPGGLLALEVGAGQAAAVRQYLHPGYDDIAVLRDYSGIERVVAGRRAQGTRISGANT